ncbi:MAG: ANTAR domain-containing protein [Ileibacterium sp.]|nr:ANTAR domain-containing protein [Ileibacterium sp.]
MNKQKVLIAASSPDAFKDLFSKSKYETVLEVSAAAAKRRLMNEEFSLVVIGWPLTDQSELQAAREIASVYEKHVLLFVPADILDQAQYQCAEQTVFVMALPVNKLLARQTVAFLDKVNGQKQKLRSDLARQKQKLQDEKIIFRCKLLLVERYRWSEDKAHSYITKKAMDHSTTKVNVARILIRKLEA